MISSASVLPLSVVTRAEEDVDPDGAQVHGASHDEEVAADMTDADEGWVGGGGGLSVDCGGWGGDGGSWVGSMGSASCLGTSGDGSTTSCLLSVDVVDS